MFKRKRKVRVYVQDGPTIEGILACRTRHAYVIWAPRVIPGDGLEPIEMSGHVEIPRERVLYYQVVG